MNEAIPLEYIKKYTGELLEIAADKLIDRDFKFAVLQRANHILDLVQAWKENESKNIRNT